MVCIAALALSFGVLWGTSYVLSVHYRSQAERLLQQNIAELNCARTTSTMAFAVRSSRLSRPLRRTEWDYLGLRPWRVMAHIETRNSKLDDMSS
jgi:hypothetical protein